MGGKGEEVWRVPDGKNRLQSFCAKEGEEEGGRQGNMVKTELFLWRKGGSQRQGETDHKGMLRLAPTQTSTQTYTTK